MLKNIQNTRLGERVILKKKKVYSRHFEKSAALLSGSHDGQEQQAKHHQQTAKHKKI